MASQLKRKRGPIPNSGSGLDEIAETPKRAKSVKVKEKEKDSLPTPISSQTGWDAAFNPPSQTSNSLIQTNANEANGDEAIDFESYIAGEGAEVVRAKDEEQERKKREKQEKRLLKAVKAKREQAWRVSEPIGGRMIDVDPVFTRDEK